MGSTNSHVPLWVEEIGSESLSRSMSYGNKKHKREMTLSGRLAHDAEILINGATAGLEDLQVDDRVTVTGREEKRDGQRQLVATRVNVERQEVPPPDTATRPAEEKAG